MNKNMMKIISLAMALIAAGACADGRGFKVWTAGGCDEEGVTIFCSTNGTDWFRQGLGSVPAIALSSITAARPGVVWVAGATHEGYPALYHSSDSGATWTRQGDSSSLTTNELHKIRAVSSRIAWAVGLAGTVVMTEDGGANWTHLPIPGYAGALQGVAAIDARTAWVSGASEDGQAAALFHTTDGDLLFWAEEWGGPGFVPAAGDYNMNRRSDLAVYDAGYWFVRDTDGETILSGEEWGGTGFTPVSGDYDGDGISDLAVYYGGYWYVARVDGTTILYAAHWGAPGFEPAGRTDSIPAPR